MTRGEAASATSVSIDLLEEQLRRRLWRYGEGYWSEERFASWLMETIQALEPSRQERLAQSEGPNWLRGLRLERDGALGSAFRAVRALDLEPAAQRLGRALAEEREIRRGLEVTERLAQVEAQYQALIDAFELSSFEELATLAAARKLMGKAQSCLEVGARSKAKAMVRFLDQWMATWNRPARDEEATRRHLEVLARFDGESERLGGSLLERAPRLAEALIDDLMTRHEMERPDRPTHRISPERRAGYLAHGERISNLYRRLERWLESPRTPWETLHGEPDPELEPRTASTDP